jgi:DNA-binding CsgD family transcriptional regulator
MKKRRNAIQGYFSIFMKQIQTKEDVKIQLTNYYLNKYKCLNKLIEIMPCAIYILNYQQQKFIYISEDVHHLIGYDSLHFTSNSLEWYLKQFHPEDLKEFKEQIFEKYITHLKNQKKESIRNIQFSINYRFKKPTNEFIQLLDNYTVLEVDEENNPIMILGVLSDINKYKSDNKIIFEINENFENEPIKLNEIIYISKDKTFTKRQQEIISLIKNGDSSKDIAKKLGLSIHTINAHRSKMLEKFNCKNSSELLNFYHSVISSKDD